MASPAGHIEPAQPVEASAALRDYTDAQVAAEAAARAAALAGKADTAALAGYYTEAEVDALLLTAGQVEVSYAEITSTAAPVLAANGVADIPGLEIVVPPQTRPVIVELYLPNVAHSVASARVRARLTEVGNAVYLAQVEKTMSATAGRGDELVVRRRLAPSSTSRTIRGTVAVAEAGTATVSAGLNFFGVDLLPYLTAVRV